MKFFTALIFLLVILVSPCFSQIPPIQGYWKFHLPNGDPNSQVNSLFNGKTLILKSNDGIIKIIENDKEIGVGTFSSGLSRVQLSINGASMTLSGIYSTSQEMFGNILESGTEKGFWKAMRSRLKWKCGGHEDSAIHYADTFGEMKEATQKYHCKDWQVAK